MEDDLSLASYEVVEGSTLQCVLRLRGGMMHVTSGRDGSFTILGGMGGYTRDTPYKPPLFLAVGVDGAFYLVEVELCTQEGLESLI